MTTISRALAARQTSAGMPWVKELVVILNSCWASYTTWRVEQAAIRELWAMSDRELKDIGLTRGEIASAVSNPGSRIKWRAH